MQIISIFMVCTWTAHVTTQIGISTIEKTSHETSDNKNYAHSNVEHSNRKIVSLLFHLKPHLMRFTALNFRNYNFWLKILSQKPKNCQIQPNRKRNKTNKTRNEMKRNEKKTSDCTEKKNESSNFVVVAVSRFALVLVLFWTIRTNKLWILRYIEIHICEIACIITVHARHETSRTFDKWERMQSKCKENCGAHQ